MERLSFLADEHVRRAYVNALRANGFDLTAVAEENSGRSDDHHLGTARDRDLVVLTNDDDFVRLAQEHEHSGIVFYNEQTHDPSEFVTAVRRLDEQFSAEAMRDHVEWLENWL